MKKFTEFLKDNSKSKTKKEKKKYDENAVDSKHEVYAQIDGIQKAVEIVRSEEKL
jgi:hypothetical protein